jgi:hypothetical protein
MGKFMLRAPDRKPIARRAAPLLLAGALAVPLFAVAAPASAASSAMACSLQVGRTHKSGSTIVGYGSQADCGPSGTSYLTIQRSRWYGWEPLVTVTLVGSGYDKYVRYNCSGTGTHTYRTIHTGRTVGGQPRFNESNHFRVSC